MLSQIRLIFASLLTASSTVTVLLSTSPPHRVPVNLGQPTSITQRLSPTNNSQASKLAALEQAIHTQVNQYRISQGLAPLTLDSRISEQARLHSQAMSKGQVPFGHQGFKQRVQVIAQTIPYRRVGENVAYNQGFAQPDRQAVQGWLKSPGHLANIRGNYALTGIGVALNSKGEYYFTQIFLRRQ